MTRRFGPIHFLPGPNRGKYPFCHSVYVEAERRVLIDPASDRATLKALRDGPGVDEVWLSHYHSKKVIEQREALLLELLSEPRTMAQVVDARIVYLKAREPKPFYDWAEAATMGKHLARLIAGGQVCVEGDCYVCV